MKTKVLKTYNYIIRIIIIVATYTFLYFQIFHKRKLEDLYPGFKDLINQPGFVYGIILVFALMLINWGIETFKWQFLIRKIEKVKFPKAFKAILTGISVSAFLPNRVGDYFGRVFILEKANHIEGILITIVGSISQLITTIIIGSVGLLIFIPDYMEHDSFLNYFYYGILAVLVIGNLLILLFYFNIGILTNFLRQFTRPNWIKLRENLHAFSLFSKIELLNVLFISILRYLIFSFQFYLLLRFFSVKIPVMDAFILISVVYLFLTAIPTVALAELGVRGSVSIFIIGMFFTHADLLTNKIELGILSAASALWLINIVIPAMAGTIFVYNLKFFRRNNGSKIKGKRQKDKGKSEVKI